MKIVFVINALRGGGAERVLTMIANYLVEHGYEVSIIVFTKDTPFYSLNPLINLIQFEHKLENKNILSKIKFLYQRIVILRNFFIQTKADMIISFMTETNIFATISAKLALKKIILSEHTNFDRNNKGLLKYIRRIIYPISNELVVLTNYDKEKYKFVKNVTVIKNPLIITQNYQFTERKKILLAVGSLIHVKGFDMLIKAFSILKNDGWILKIVGEGKERKNLEILIQKYNLEKKVFLPGVTKEIEKEYREASIFVLSSRAEGFPGVLCEAMGYGCASIAFNCLTGPSDIIKHEKTGILVPPNNIKLLSQAMDDLICNEEKRNYLSINAKNIVNDLDINKIMMQWISLLNKYNKKSV